MTLDPLQRADIPKFSDQPNKGADAAVIAQQVEKCQGQEEGSKQAVETEEGILEHIARLERLISFYKDRAKLNNARMHTRGRYYDPHEAQVLASYEVEAKDLLLQKRAQLRDVQEGIHQVSLARLFGVGVCVFSSPTAASVTGLWCPAGTPSSPLLRDGPSSGDRGETQDYPRHVVASTWSCIAAYMCPQHLGTTLMNFVKTAAPMRSEEPTRHKVD